MARSRLSPHRMTGGTGTPRTWTLASVVAPRRKPPQPPGATWRMSSRLSSHPLDRAGAMQRLDDEGVAFAWLGCPMHGRGWIPSGCRQSVQLPVGYLRLARHPESVGSHLGVTFHKRTSGQRIRESVLGLGSELPFTHEARNTVMDMPGHGLSDKPRDGLNSDLAEQHRLVATDLMAQSRRGPGSIGRNRFNDKLTPRRAKATFD
jgi:hypothetical protein